MPTLPSASIPDEKRAELLDKISNGHDLESACAALDISESQLTAGGAKLKADISRAFRAGTAKLRGKIMEGALSSDNVSVLMKLLEARQIEQEAELAKAADKPLDRQRFGRELLFLFTETLHHDPETRDEVMARVLKATCLHCGRPPYTPSPPTPSLASTSST